MTVELRPIGTVESPLTELASAPRQPDEDAPAGVLVLDERWAPALEGLRVGDHIVVITWLDRADRTVVRVHPRGDLGRPATGVMATRSPDRPNPIGLHTTTISAVDGTRITVDRLEALHGTPVLDIKPVLGSVPER